jgi:DNA modification methylase
MTVRILEGDCRSVLALLPDASVHCCVTSPPYWGLRDYGHGDQIGLEASPQAFVDELVQVFREVRRVLRDDGTLWLNLGDCYAGSRKGGDSGKSSIHSAQHVHSSAAQVAMVASRRRDGAPVPRSDVCIPGLKPKDLVGMPWRVAFALQADGWWLRQDIVWHKPNPMPESVRDRCTKAHEYVFLLSKSERYYFDAEAITEAAIGTNAHDLSGRTKQRSAMLAAGSIARTGGRITGGTEQSTLGRYADGTRNRRSVWTIATQPFSDAHFATMAPDLARDCVLAGCPQGGTVLDPFGGAGTTGLVADRHQRDAVLIELNPEYAELARRRVTGDAPLFAEVN